MDESQLFDRLDNLAKDKDKRIDSYIDTMRSVLKDSPKWNENTERVFKHIEKEVNQTRLMRNIFVGITIVLIAAVAALFLWDRSEDIKLDNLKDYESFLVEKAQNSALPLEFRNDTNREGVAIYISKNSEGIRGDEKKEFEELAEKFPALGRLYGVGEQRWLGAKLDFKSNDSFWKIHPINQTDKIIGKINVNMRYGLIGLDRVSNMDIPHKFDEPHQYFNFNGVGLGFYMRVIKYDAYKGIYTIQFGKKIAKDIVWKDDSDYNVKRSISGVLDGRTFRVTKKEWGKTYVVTTGIGNIGELDNKNVAWNLNSLATEIELGE